MPEDPAYSQKPVYSQSTVDGLVRITDEQEALLNRLQALTNVLMRKWQRDSKLLAAVETIAKTRSR